MKILFFPLILIGKLIEGIFKITGRLMAAILGFVFIILGIVLSLTVIGAIIGVPLCIIGFLMILRGIF